MKPLYIFDLDGTLALNEHRRHMLESDDREKWRRIFSHKRAYEEVYD